MKTMRSGSAERTRSARGGAELIRHSASLEASITSDSLVALSGVVVTIVSSVVGVTTPACCVVVVAELDSVAVLTDSKTKSSDVSRIPVDVASFFTVVMPTFVSDMSSIVGKAMSVFIVVVMPTRVSDVAGKSDGAMSVFNAVVPTRVSYVAGIPNDVVLVLTFAMTVEETVDALIVNMLENPAE